MMNRRSFLAILGLAAPAVALAAKDMKPAPSAIPQWKPNTEYKIGDFFQIDNVWATEKDGQWYSRGVVCEVVEAGTSGFRVTSWPSWGKSNIYFSGDRVRAIVRQELVLDKVSGLWYPARGSNFQAF